MAFLGQFIPRHKKFWSVLSLSLANAVTKRSYRCFSSEAAFTSTNDYPLIQEAAINQNSEVGNGESKTFEELFKKSAFVCLGNPKGKVVVGTVKKVVEDSVYIDFGWKFPCVCPLPSEGSRSFFPGRKVRIMIKELELATKFLGSNAEVTLNEADCVLLGLYNPRTVGEPLNTAPKQKEDAIQKPQIKTSISDIFIDTSISKEANEIAKE